MILLSMRNGTCDEYCRRLIVAPVRNKRVDDGGFEDDIASLSKLSVSCLSVMQH